MTRLASKIDWHSVPGVVGRFFVIASAMASVMASDDGRDGIHVDMNNYSGRF